MQTGWLDPTGTFYPCKVFEHVEMANDLVDLLKIESPTYHGDETLLKNGWVQITRSLLGVKEQNIFWEKFLTEYQKQFLRPYFEENDEPVSSTAMKRWEFETDR